MERIGGDVEARHLRLVDAVAATVAPLTAEPGVYNVVDDDPLPVCEWLPAFARWVRRLRFMEHDELLTFPAQPVP